jgi:hypothetical protein
LPFDSAALAASLQDQLVNASDLALALFVLLCSSGLFRCSTGTPRRRSLSGVHRNRCPISPKHRGAKTDETS